MPSYTPINGTSDLTGGLYLKDLPPISASSVVGIRKPLEWRNVEVKVPVFQHDKLVTELIRKGKHIYATGSRVTTHFKPESDYDYVVLDPEYKLCTEYERQGWLIGGSGNRHNPDFNSIKATDTEGITVNLICVSEKETFNKYVMASDLIRTVDPETKEERVKLFDLIFKNNELPF